MRQYFEVNKTGALGNVQLKQSDIPALPLGSVLISVKAIGLNYADIFAILGLYSATPAVPFIPGLEFAGTVIESKSTLFKSGDRVMGVTRFGGYDSHIIADPHYLLPLPESWNFDQGAAFPVQTFTAYYALKSLGDIREGHTVLIHSGAGGVGLQAHKIAKKYNAYTIGVVGNHEKLTVLKDHGYDGGIVRSSRFRDDLKTALGERPLDLVLEATGGKYFRYSYEALAATGRLIAYGSAHFTSSSGKIRYLPLFFKWLRRPRIDPLTMISANKSVMAFNLIWIYERKDLLKKLVEENEKLELSPPEIGHRYPFAHLREALTEFASGTTTGKVVVWL